MYSPDLLFLSQVRGTAESCGWRAQTIIGAQLPPDGVDGDIIVVDCTRDLPRAWAVLEAVKPACPWLVLAAHQHVHVDVGEEALRRGATEVVRRGAILSRLAQYLGRTDAPGGPFVGEPPKPAETTPK